MPFSFLRPFSAAALALLLASVPVAAQQQAPQSQQPAPGQRDGADLRTAVVPIDQATLDQWLAYVSESAPRLSEDRLDEQQTNTIVSESCTKAGFTDVDQCQSVDDYLNALIAGGDDQTKRFVDPTTKLRESLRELLANAQIPAADKAQARREIEDFIATLPTDVPPEHIALLNANADRIFALIEKLAGNDATGSGSGDDRGAPVTGKQ